MALHLEYGLGSHARACAPDQVSVSVCVCVRDNRVRCGAQTAGSKAWQWTLSLPPHDRRSDIEPTRKCDGRASLCHQKRGPRAGQRAVSGRSAALLAIPCRGLGPGLERALARRALLGKGQAPRLLLGRRLRCVERAHHRRERRLHRQHRQR